MNNPYLYSKGSVIQRQDTEYVLNTYFNRVEFSEDGEEYVLDVGCAGGEFTANHLLKRMPDTVQKLIGCDISQEMIKHAIEINNDRRLEFLQLDIATKTLPMNMIEHFHHVMSFYCLHWVPDQRQAYENIYKLLRPNGKMFLTHLATNPIFEIYELLAKKARWKPYMFDVERFISPFQYSISPSLELRRMLEEIGFEIDLCKCEKRMYVFDNRDIWYKSVKSVNPFIHRIPENMKADYFEDILHEIKNLKLIEENNNGQKVYTPYKIFVIYAKK